MKRYILLLSALFAATLSAVAQRPLYIVNGVETEEIESQRKMLLLQSS